MAALSIETSVRYSHEVAFATYPPRVGVMLCGLNWLNSVDNLIGLKRLLDLQHEYPGEAFYAIHDANGHKSSSTVTSVATAILAYGMQADKAVMYCYSDLRKAHESFTRALFSNTPSPANKLKESRSECVLALQSAIHAIAMRATILASDVGLPALDHYLQYVVNRFNSACNAPVLTKPKVHQFDPQLCMKVTEGANTDECTRLFFGSPTQWLKRSMPQMPVLQSKTFSGPASINFDIKVGIQSELEQYCAFAAARYEDLERHPDYVTDVLREGAKTAKNQLAVTMAIFQSKVGLERK